MRFVGVLEGVPEVQAALASGGEEREEHPIGGPAHRDRHTVADGGRSQDVVGVAERTVGREGQVGRSDALGQRCTGRDHSALGGCPGPGGLATAAGTERAARRLGRAVLHVDPEVVEGAEDLGVGAQQSHHEDRQQQDHHRLEQHEDRHRDHDVPDAEQADAPVGAVDAPHADGVLPRRRPDGHVVPAGLGGAGEVLQRRRDGAGRWCRGRRGCCRRRRGCCRRRWRRWPGSTPTTRTPPPTSCINSTQPNGPLTSISLKPSSLSRPVRRSTPQTHTRCFPAVAPTVAS